MSSPKKELIIGSVIVIITSMWLINIGTSITEIESQPLLVLSVTLNNIISWFVTFCAIGAIVSGLWVITQVNKPLGKWVEKYTIRATIPGYFSFALSPVIMGLLILFLTHQTNWGVGIACLSVPATLIFLFFAIKRNNMS